MNRAMRGERWRPMWRLPLQLEVGVETFGHAPEPGNRMLERALAGGGQPIVLLPPAAPFRRRLAEAAGDEALVFEPLERLVHGPKRHVAPGPVHDVFADGHAVGILTQPHKR